MSNRPTGGGGIGQDTHVQGDQNMESCSRVCSACSVRLPCLILAGVRQGVSGVGIRGDASIFSACGVQLPCLIFADMCTEVRILADMCTEVRIGEAVPVSVICSVQLSCLTLADMRQSVYGIRIAENVPIFSTSGVQPPRLTFAR